MILDRDEWACRYCGDTKLTLHVHHQMYEGNPWEVEDYMLITLCSDCHELVHIAKTNLEKFLLDCMINRVMHEETGGTKTLLLVIKNLDDFY